MNSPTWTTGKFGGALDFDGNDDYVLVPSSDSLKISGDQMSGFAWVYWRGTEYSVVFAKHYYYAYELMVRTDRIQVDLRAGGTQKTIYTTNTVPVNTWTYVGFTYNGSQVSFYRDGVLLGDTYNNQITGNIGTTDDDFAIGRRYPGGGWGELYFNGKIDEVMVFDQALSEQEIQQLYEQGYIGGVQSGETCYYYHYDGLGSVVALSNSAGNTIQTYEYNVYGQVAASDPNLTNPFMFTGRRFDFETGLYYYRARYYNPYIGRFLQTDPVGYGNGINWYHYCSNNPLNWVDPSGLLAVAFYDGNDLGGGDGITNGAQFKEAADDDEIWNGTHYFDYSFDMSRYKEEGYASELEYILAMLSSIEEEITDVYFYDHCRHGAELLEFGESVVSTIKYSEFWGRLGSVLPDGATINLRHCFVGCGKIILPNLAKWTGRAVTGVAGKVEYEGSVDYVPENEGGGPEYVMRGDLMIAKPDGTLVLLWPAYLINPWGYKYSNPNVVY
jgi:RHS repeat-associated protein